MDIDSTTTEGLYTFPFSMYAMYLCVAVSEY